MASAAATDGVEWKWLVKNDNYLLKLLNLPADLKRGDLLVRVDGKRRLTITDQRKPTTGDKALLLNKKTFQLPKTANHDAITGCFDGDVLTLTVPNKAAKKKEEEAKARAQPKREKELIDTAVAAKKEEEPKAKAEPEPEPEPEPEREREKELIDTAVAAFTLGVLFSHKLFSSRNQ